MKKIISICLIASLMLTLFAGCSGKNNGAKDKNLTGDAAKITRVEQKAISDDGLGRATYYAGGLPFRVGDTLDQFAESGFEVSEGDYNTIIDPWGFFETYVIANGEYVYLSVMNESDEPQPLAYCRAVKASMISGVVLDKEIELAVSTVEDVKNKYGTDNILREVKEDSYAEEIYLCYGSILDNIVFSFEDNVLKKIEILCVDNLFDEVEYSQEDLNSNLPLLQMTLMANYIDVKEFKEADGLSLTFDFDEKMGGAYIPLVLEDTKINIGKDLAMFESIGFVCESSGAFSDESTKNVEANSSRSYSGGGFSFKGKEIDGVSVFNVEDEDLPIEKTYISGVEFYNDKATSAVCDDGPEFELWGITNDSTIEDIIAKLGMPTDYGNIGEFPTLVWMEYNMYTEDGSYYWIKIYVNPILNEIYKLELVCRSAYS